MDNLKAVIEVLGEDNAERLKSSIVDIILDNIRNDFENYTCYLLDPDDVAEFVEECKKEVFEKIKEDVVNDMMKNIKESI